MYHWMSQQQNGWINVSWRKEIVYLCWSCWWMGLSNRQLRNRDKLLWLIYMTHHMYNTWCIPLKAQAQDQVLVQVDLRWIMVVHLECMLIVVYLKANSLSAERSQPAETAEQSQPKEDSVQAQVSQDFLKNDVFAWLMLHELHIILVILNKCKKGKLSKISPSPAGKLKKVKLFCSSRSVSETPVMQDSGKQALR